MEEKEKLIERIRWWLYHPRFELIYLLGGVPKEHCIGEGGTGALHYRNIRAVMSSLKKRIGVDYGYSTPLPKE